MRYSLRCGITVHSCPVREVVDKSIDQVQRGKPVHIVTVNPEIVVAAMRDEKYREVIQDASFRTIDGVGICYSIYRTYGEWPRRITGIDLTLAMLEECIPRGIEVMIVGAREKVRERFESQLTLRGALVVEGFSPRVDENGVLEDERDIPAELPSRALILVALGHPKQELWISRRMGRSKGPNIYIGVGGTVDYLAEEVRRAPAVVRKVGGEWLYRLLTDPQKRFRRQANTLPRYVWNELIQQKW